MLARHGWRFASFSGIGAFVLVAGIAVQAVLVHFGAGAYGSYAGQAVISIELSLVLNWRFTWKSRKVGFWRSGWKFNAQKFLLTVPNLAVYALLIRVGLGWLLANLASTAVFTVVNYATGEMWSFAKPGRRRPGSTLTAASRPPRPTALPRGRVPAASVIIPCKGNQATIRATVDSLLAQDYPGLAEVILVGDIGDSTWMAIQDVCDSRLVVLELEAVPGKRDPNAKRDAGIGKAAGDILALVDSDVVVDPDWLSRAAAMLLAQGGGMVAGGMRSVHDTFWGRFVDRNVLAAKTPRLGRPYQVTDRNFGHRGCKPPVTANAVFTRALYDDCPVDVSWAYGYEDYEWFWRVAKGGHQILFTAELTAAHHHRRSFRHLAREYRQSAQGCAHFVRRHADSPLARKRRRQAIGLPVAAAASVLGAITMTIAGYEQVTIALLAAAVLTFTAREVIAARSLEAAGYLPASLTLGCLYTAHLARGLIWTPPPAPAPVWTSGEPSRRRWWRGRICWPLAAVLSIQTGLSLSLVWSNTVFGDEATYLTAGRLEWAHWLHGSPLPGTGQGNFGFSGSFQSYFSGAPQIYPPLGALASYAGGLAAARILGMLFMLGASILLYLTATRLTDRRAALFAVGLWAVCGSVLRLAFATYDPMAIFLICAGTWTAVESGYRRRRGELICLSAACLALGAVTAYSYAIFIPAAIAVAALSWTSLSGFRQALTFAAWLAGATCTLLVAAVVVLQIWAGILSTTLARQSGNSGILSVARTSWEITGLITVLAVVGVVAALRGWERPVGTVLLALCTAMAFTVPLEQAHLDTGTSLDKHLALGAWFAAISAGYGLARLVGELRLKGLVAAACAAAAIVLPAMNGWISAFNVYHLWPDAVPLVQAMRPLVARSQGNLLVVQYSSTAEYYLGQSPNWQRWTALSLNPSYAGYGPARWPAYYEAQIASDDPGLIALPMSVTFTSPASGNLLLSNLSTALRTDNKAEIQLLLQVASADISSAEPGLFDLATAIADDPRYRLASIVPYDSHIATGVFVLWSRAPRSAIQDAATRHVVCHGRYGVKYGTHCYDDTT